MIKYFSADLFMHSENVKSRFVIPPFLIALILAGCSRAPTIVGKWKVDPMFSPAGVRKEVMDNYRLTTKLEFKDDKTWTSPSSSGSYTITNDKFVAKTLVVMNRDIVRDGLTAYYPDMTGELSADGSYLTVHFPNTNNDSAFKDVKMVPDN